MYDDDFVKQINMQKPNCDSAHQNGPVGSKVQNDVWCKHF